MFLGENKYFGFSRFHHLPRFAHHVLPGGGIEKIQYIFCFPRNITFLFINIFLLCFHTKHMCPAEFKSVLFFWCCSIVSMCFLCCQWKTLSWVTTYLHNPIDKTMLQKSKKSRFFFFSIAYKFFIY